MVDRNRRKAGRQSAFDTGTHADHRDAISSPDAKALLNPADFQEMASGMSAAGAARLEMRGVRKQIRRATAQAWAGAVDSW